MCAKFTLAYTWDIPFSFKSLIVEPRFIDKYPKTMQLTNNKLEKQYQNICLSLVVA